MLNASFPAVGAGMPSGMAQVQEGSGTMVAELLPLLPAVPLIPPVPFVPPFAVVPPPPVC